MKCGTLSSRSVSVFALNADPAFDARTSTHIYSPIDSAVSNAGSKVSGLLTSGWRQQQNLNRFTAFRVHHSALSYLQHVIIFLIN